MNQKIFVFDYDGTICQKGGSRIPEEIARLLARLQNNHVIILATGRPDFLVSKDERFHWDAQVYYNGQLCIAHNHILYSNQLNYHQYKNFAKHALDIGVEYIAFSDRPFSPHRKLHLPLLKEVTGGIIETLPVSEGLGVYKLIVEATKTSEELVRKWIPSSQIVKWHPAFWEVLPQNTDKSMGISHILNYMSAQWSDIIAFGDSKNDLCVFQNAAVSITVGDCPSLTKFATFHVPDFAHNGMEWAFQNILLGENNCEPNN